MDEDHVGRPPSPLLQIDVMLRSIERDHSHSRITQLTLSVTATAEMKLNLLVESSRFVICLDQVCKKWLEGCAERESLLRLQLTEQYFTLW